MSRRSLIVLAVLAIIPLLTLPNRPPERLASGESPTTESSEHQASLDLLDLPMLFEPNRGQTDDQVLYLSRGCGYALFLTPDEAVFSLRSPTRSPNGSDSRPRDVVRLRLKGATRSCNVAGVEEIATKSNYLIGNDPDKWLTDVPNYARVVYQSVYPGIDLAYYGNQRELEYDFIIGPGADPDQIRLSFQGVEQVQIDREGNLIMASGEAEVVQKRPVVYQEIAGARTNVQGEYLLKGKSEVGFRVGDYDASLPLVIDPVLLFSTYFGSYGGDGGEDIAVDASGNAYVTGFVESADFPVVNPAQPSHGGGLSDVFVSKIRPDGAALIYSTFLGGGRSDVGFGIDVDSAGSAYVTGFTQSFDDPGSPGNDGFPLSNPLQPSFGGPEGDGDTFLSKLAPSGSALVYSTYLGNNTHDAGLGIDVDPAGNAYITGFVGAGVFNDVFVMKVSSTGQALAYSIRLGGSSEEIGRAIAVDESGKAYITGETFSSNFPVLNAFQSVKAGSNDAFVSMLDANGGLLYSTYFGGNSSDDPSGIAVDGAGRAYVTGGTFSNNFPTRGAFQTDQPLNDAFVAKFDPTASSSDASLIYSTYLGGSRSDAGQDITVDAAGNAHVTGSTGSSNFPTTPDAPQPTKPGLFDGDAFIAILNHDGTGIEFGTFLGGTSSDTGNGIALSAQGKIYITGQTTSANFPLVNPLQTNLDGGRDAFVAVLQLGCQLDITRLSQGGTAPWANDVYDTSNLRIRALGCALTCLAMALNHAGVATNPGVLNVFMIQNGGYQGRSVVFRTATQQVAAAQSDPILSSLKFHDRRINSLSDPDEAIDYLEDIVCKQGFPVVVGVDLDAQGDPQHYVLVTGKQGDEFTIADPGFAGRTTLSSYPNFETRGHVADPPGDISSLVVSVGDGAELLVTDSAGNRTGFDPGQGRVEEIPRSVYFRDSLENDETGEPPTETTHSAPIFQPAQGTYRILLTGLKTGLFQVLIDAFAQDGTPQPQLRITGFSGGGSATSFEIQFVSSSGGVTQAVRLATFASTLGDIANAAQLGLIDNHGIAKSLSSKIEAASAAADRRAFDTSRNILEAFKHHVTAQTGKHIDSIAAQVLLEDADSLIRQLGQ